jgi:hypothetical protein
MAGKSLQAYLWDVIAREAARPTLSEVTARAEAEASARLSGDDVLSAIDDARRGRRSSPTVPSSSSTSPTMARPGGRPAAGNVPLLTADSRIARAAAARCAIETVTTAEAQQAAT